MNLIIFRWPDDGETLCTVAISFEVIVLTSSIYNFVFLNVDRYLIDKMTNF